VKGGKMSEGLTERLEKLEKNLEPKEEEQKKFKLPWSIRLQKGKYLRKEYCVVMFIKGNRSVEFKSMKIEDDTIMFNDKIYDARAGNMLNYKKLPILILKEWDMKPISLEEEYQRASEQGTLTAAQKLILTKMKMEAIKPKMSLNWKTVIIGLVVIGVGYGALSYMGYI